MILQQSVSIRTILCLWVFILYFQPSYSFTGEHPVLIISSYNPDARNTSSNISDFMEEFERLGGKCGVSLENMNCKSFSEVLLWKQRMMDILSKYKGDREPSVILLIGQEACVTYLSQKDSVRSDVPVIVALASRNVALLPNDGVDPKSYMPQRKDFLTDFRDKPIQSGFIYEYDVASNVYMIKKLYPNTRNIAFISDNSYGGVTLQSHVIEEMKAFPDLNLILLDGRVNTIYTISEKLRELPDNTVLLMGTWRVDMNDGYFMRNATYSMMEAAPDLPVFSITSVGMGYWAVGGVMPEYRQIGKDLAVQAINLLSDSKTNKKKNKIETIPCEMVMDSKVIGEQNLDISSIQGPIRMMNLPPSFYDQYKYQIIAFFSVLCILLFGLLISLYFFYRTKKLKDDLEESQEALLKAKNKAEEASRLKSSFLANMSHEIRTPLNAIVGFSDVLSAGETSLDEQRGYFDIIKTNSDLLLRLINDILDVSRLEADRAVFCVEKCDVVQVCNQVLASVIQARRSDNQIVFECDFETLEMRTDVQRLQQVIINLLSNADKFTRNGKITLKLELDETGKMAIFSITDTGCGIPIEKQERVFERFEKLDEYAQGTGLGLSICQLTVKKWNGVIGIDSSYTDGARFFFTHPLNLEIA